MAAELRQLIQQEDPMVRQRHVAGHRYLSATNQPHIRDRMVRGATRPRRDERGAIAGETGNAVDAGGVEGFGEGIIVLSALHPCPQRFRVISLASLFPGLASAARKAVRDGRARDTSSGAAQSGGVHA
jgi:hypothetical protein